MWRVLRPLALTFWLVNMMNQTQHGAVNKCQTRGEAAQRDTHCQGSRKQWGQSSAYGMIAAYTPLRVLAQGGNSRYFGPPYLTGAKGQMYHGQSSGESNKAKKCRQLTDIFSLTGKWPISEDTLSDTYMMFPSVVNAIKKPSRACGKREREGQWD